MNCNFYCMFDVATHTNSYANGERTYMHVLIIVVIVGDVVQNLWIITDNTLHPPTVAHVNANDTQNKIRVGNKNI